MRNRKNRVTLRGAQGLCALLACSMAQAEELMPLPGDVFRAPAKPNPVIGLADKLIGSTGMAAPTEIPSALQVENTGGDISYDQEKKIIRYDGGQSPIRLRTDNGADMQVHAMQADMQQGVAALEGPLTLCRDEMMVRAAGNGTYDWKAGQVSLSGVRAKVNGLLVRGSAIEYKKDEQGKSYLVIHDAYVTTEDVQTPSSWVGTGTLTVYPGDSGTISRLSIAGSETDIPVPVFGWIEFSHSLNPQEGYMPVPGSKSNWGAYLLNRYGVLLGNRRTHGLMPTADYLATLHADIRARRGAAVGLDFENLERDTEHSVILKTYFLDDADPTISPLEQDRAPMDSKRYRLSAEAYWNLDTDSARKDTKWKAAANINVLSDRYVLRDFFEEINRTDDKPDNTLRLTRRDAVSESRLYTRFAPNDYYMSDERAEASYYRVRTPIGRSGISYETSNSATVMRQYLPVEQRLRYQEALSYVTDPELQDYYRRQLNSESYMRVNTTHELSAGAKLFGFLNVTPKTGAGYTGYYDVGGVGADNRFLGFAACDVEFKLHREYRNFSYRRLGLQGLTHIVHPYASLSHTSISSSNPLVPRVDSWSSTLGNSTSSPMPLDLCGINGIDGWGSWDVLRLGLQNIFNSESDGDKVRLINWNTFFDINLDDKNSNSRYSNVYSYISFHPSERLSFSMDTQDPLIGKGDSFYLHRIHMEYQPVAWWEGRMGYACIKDHPLQRDSEQVYLQSNLRINEKYTVAGRWHFDIERKRMPIQQYSVFRNSGAWYVGATLFIRDNGGKKEEGFGISFTLGETGSALPINLY